MTDDPAFGQHHELPGVGAPDDLHVDLLANGRQSALELRRLAATAGVEFLQETETV